MKKQIAITIFACLLLFGIRIAFFTSHPVRVAILDTGIDSKDAVLSTHLIAGKDNLVWLDAVFMSQRGARDVDGHGTRVAKLILAESKDVRLIPIQITQTGSGITPEILKNALRFAIDNEAKIIHCSFGILGNFPEVSTLLDEAAQKGIILVTASGIGMPNPFKPLPLSSLTPQSHKSAIVVGTTKNPNTFDPISNFGPELSLVLVSPLSGYFIEGDKDSIGSSFAAAKVTGLIAHALSKKPKLTPTQIRQELMTASKIPDVTENPTKLGSGVLDPMLFVSNTLNSR